jgi:hypothetical protein
MPIALLLDSGHCHIPNSAPACRYSPASIGKCGNDIQPQNKNHIYMLTLAVTTITSVRGFPGPSDPRVDHSQQEVGFVVTSVLH